MNTLKESLNEAKLTPEECIVKWSITKITDENIRTAVKECIKVLGKEADLNFLDVSSVTDMHDLFTFECFNGDISNWNVSKVTDMRYMFYFSGFNGDISKWNVSSVKEMSYMFKYSDFNGDISKWDVNNVTMHKDFCFVSPLQKKPEWQPKFK